LGLEKRIVWGILLLLPAILGGCDQAMSSQPKPRPLGESSFFADGRSARMPVPGTVAQDELRNDEHLYEGKVGGLFAADFPFPVSSAVLARGRERYDIFCSPCHDRTGSGQGLVVARGYRAPPSFHQDRLRGELPGRLFDVITHGQGAMPSYADQIPASDRWCIIGYLRALQRSQWASKEELPSELRLRLEAEPP